MARLLLQQPFFSQPFSSIARHPEPFPSNAASRFPVAFASTKQKKRRSSTTSKKEHSQRWSFDHLMLVWDEVFDKCCEVPSQASLLRDVSIRGLASYGRGCVLVCQTVQTKPRGSGSGFTSKSSKSSLELPAYVPLDWSATYVPRDFILDPKKAAVDGINSTSNGSSPAVIDATPNSTPSNDKLTHSGKAALPMAPGDTTEVINDIPTSQDEMTDEYRGSLTQSEGREAEVSDACEQNQDNSVQLNQDQSVQLVSQESLLSVMRGMDTTRVLSLTANLSYQTANPMVDMKTMDAGGEEPYNSKEEELVLMLRVVVDGQQVVGADVLRAYLNDTDANGTEERYSWKLRLRNPL